MALFEWNSPLWVEKKKHNRTRKKNPLHVLSLSQFQTIQIDFVINFEIMIIARSHLTMTVSLRVSAIAKLSFVEQNILQLRLWWHKFRKTNQWKIFWIKSGISSSAAGFDGHSVRTYTHTHIGKAGDQTHALCAQLNKWDLL